MSDYTDQLKKNIRGLPGASINAAINDPVMRVFWCYYALIAVICLIAEPFIGWLTHK